MNTKHVFAAALSVVVSTAHRARRVRTAVASARPTRPLSLRPATASRSAGGSRSAGASRPACRVVPNSASIKRLLSPAAARQTQTPRPPARNRATAAVMMQSARRQVWHVVIGYRLPHSDEIHVESFGEPAVTRAERQSVNVEAFAALYDKLQSVYDAAGCHEHGAAQSSAAEPSAAESNAAQSSVAQPSAAGPNAAHPNVGRVTPDVDRDTSRSGAGTIPAPGMMGRFFGRVLGARAWATLTTRFAVATAEARNVEAGDGAASPATSPIPETTTSTTPALVYIANNQLSTEVVNLQESFPAATFVRRSDFPDVDLLDAIQSRLNKSPACSNAGNDLAPGGRLTVATDASLRLHRSGAGLACVDQFGNWSTRYARKIGDISMAEVASVSLALKVFPHRRLDLLVDSQTAVAWLSKDDAFVPRRALQLVGRTRKLLEDSGSTVTWVRAHSGHYLNETADRLSRACRRDAYFTDSATAQDRGNWIVQDAFSVANKKATPHHIDLRQFDAKSLPGRP